jgi:uncharacterized protein YfkK (UPF0435 family)
MTVNRENYNDISDVVKLVEDKNTFEVKNFVC